ncbi:hypothetical protein MTR67_012540 [Solanum verrucosum]|uniref:TBCC domain-containing protein 1 n=1 Tax=Solanum verrucosum TaxID=315347 RepID=A0AAF0QD81_SOLVR|nr:hypothetical protein MTR67_012540 [Solanum verrucosum]
MELVDQLLCASSVAYSVTNVFVKGGVLTLKSILKFAPYVSLFSFQVVNCHESVLYILAPLTYATVYGCSDATIVLGAVGKAVRVEHCERVHVIAAAKRICIANCRECVFFLGVNQAPLVVGDNHKLQSPCVRHGIRSTPDRLSRLHHDCRLDRRPYVYNSILESLIPTMWET